MQLIINMNLDNAAFDDPDELKRILEDIANRAVIEPYSYMIGIRDINGNRIGYYELEV